MGKPSKLLETDHFVGIAKLSLTASATRASLDAMDDNLIDRIYECAFTPEHWPGVFDDLARIADARGGFMFAANSQVLHWTASASLQAGMERFISGDYFSRSTRPARAISARHAGFIRERDVYTDDELALDPIYPEVLWPAGLGWCAATAIPSPTGDVMFLSVEREQARGPVEFEAVQRLDTLRPHLARSALMAARLQLEQARTVSETLASIGLPALVFDAGGRVLSANHLFEAQSDHVRWRARDRVMLKDPHADTLFRQAIEALPLENSAPTRSFAVRSADSRASMVAHVIPVRRSARDIFARSAGVLLMTPVTLPKAPAVELVQSLFDLTPAEARVARRLTAGQTVEDIASEGGVSLNTVRTQVRGVLEKTGCHRQIDAIALLGGIATLGV